MNFQRKFLIASVVFATLNACGNPITLEKDLRREEDRREDADSQNRELSEENRRLKELLQGVLVSDHYLWFFGELNASYELAQKICEAVGYQLPTEAQLDEFDIQIFRKNSDWTDISIDDKTFTIENMHVTPKKEGLSPEIALCMKERLQSNQ